MGVTRKTETINKIQTAEVLYTLMCTSTRAPFVKCNEDTFDDEVYVFYNEDKAEKEKEKFVEQKYPIQVLKFDKKARLGFLGSLFRLGVNAIVVNKNTDAEITIQLEELIKRNEKMTKQGQVIVENPALLLTALYFMQEFRKGASVGMTEEQKSLYEEMIAHFQKGKYFLPVKENKQVPLLKQSNGLTYLPVFTDLFEFVTFSKTKKEEKLQAMIVEGEKLPEFLKDDLAGVVLNPFGVNVPIQIQKKK